VALDQPAAKGHVVGVTRHEEHGQRGKYSAQRAGQFPSAHAGHHEIRDEHVNRCAVLPDGDECRVPVAGLHHGVPRRLKHVGDDAAHRRVILHEQDRGRRRVVMRPQRTRLERMMRRPASAC